MASGYEINTDAFETYGIQTAKLFVEFYPWYNTICDPSVHKILLHGADVIRHAILPIGIFVLYIYVFVLVGTINIYKKNNQLFFKGRLSEEAQECQNKNYKNYTEHHTRKLSRIKINDVLINMSLVSSDPLYNIVN